MTIASSTSLTPSLSSSVSPASHRPSESLSVPSLLVASTVPVAHSSQVSLSVSWHALLLFGIVSLPSATPSPSVSTSSASLSGSLAARVSEPAARSGLPARSTLIDCALLEVPPQITSEESTVMPVLVRKVFSGKAKSIKKSASLEKFIPALTTRTLPVTLV